MTRADIFDEIARLRASGRPFCLATVIRTADATSAKAGAKAAVTEAGEIRGHLGGACVAGAVVRAAGAALADGTVRVIRVRPKAAVSAPIDPDGAELHASGCPSGGTVDILIEPYRLAPMVAILGATPVAVALGRLARLMGYRVGFAAPEAEHGGLPEADRLAPAADLGPLALGPEDVAVIAVQGRGDLAAAKAALLSPAGHVAMVASRRKAHVLAERLAEAGVPAARIAALEAPAGVDLGAVEPEEIALSIMAGIVRRRRRGARDAQAPGAAG